MSDELRFLDLIAERLDGASIAYMVSGSVALMFYAEPRMTRDIDVVIDLDAADADSFARLFSSDCYVDVESVRTAARERDMFNVIHNEWVIKADFIVRKSDPYRKTEFKRRRQVSLRGRGISVVSPEDLILSKLVWAAPSASELQLRDVSSIVRSHTSIDRAYVEQWAEELGVLELWRRLA